HCIGCRLCERNCPYDNISMLENKVAPLARLKAATCDLCDAEGREDTVVPRCVYMCPHDAARRTTGQSLLNLVQGISHKL
ncbi:MAG TPA: 4Fe-4S dicluster domain-containing protein, partial [Bryocella sp.]|nr:4Fe-4S dicluster domain-containing protein [Bryocella sp.]